MCLQIEIGEYIFRKINNFFRFEYFLSDFIFKVANFDEDYIGSAFNNEGYYDQYNFGKTVLKGTKTKAIRY